MRRSGWLWVGLCLALAGAVFAQGEPSLQQILERLGYDIDVKQEVKVPLFVKAGPGPVVLKPIAAFGLERECRVGWYRPAAAGPVRMDLWLLAAEHNQRDSPLIAPGSRIEFDPGQAPFGIWVSTAGFTDETVYSEDDLQKRIARFGTNLHKAHGYVARRKQAAETRPNSYVIGWEYSTNDDNQDIVTLIQNVKPAP